MKKIVLFVIMTTLISSCSRKNFITKSSNKNVIENKECDESKLSTKTKKDTSDVLVTEDECEPSVKTEKDTSDALVAELELYPVNIEDLKSKIVKVELMVDKHIYRGSRKQFLIGSRSFGDFNMHLVERDQTDLIWYTYGYIGNKYLEIAGEIGSLSGREYVSFGPQYTHYSHSFFKRISLNTRVWPDVMFGYEYTTEEIPIGNIFLSSTGTGRLMFQGGTKSVLQTSLWISFKHFKNIYLGFEYEFNSAHNNSTHGTVDPINEFFGGLKLEF